MSNIIEKPPGFGTALFSPRAVALVGASGNLKKNTARPMRFMRKHGFEDTIYPINPGREEISWERFRKEAYDKFMNKTYKGAYEAALINEFEALLPDTPPWKKK